LERPISDGRLAAAGRIAVEWSRFSAMLMAWRMVRKMRDWRGQ
jgi:hypothetical protein